MRAFAYTGESAASLFSPSHFLLNLIQTEKYCDTIYIRCKFSERKFTERIKWQLWINGKFPMALIRARFLAAIMAILWTGFVSIMLSEWLLILNKLRTEPEKTGNPDPGLFAHFSQRCMY